MYKILIAALAAATLCSVPASASAQQNDPCEATGIARGYSARDIKDMCGDRKVVKEQRAVDEVDEADDTDEAKTRTASNIPPGAIVNVFDRTFSRVERMVSQQQRRGHRDEVEEDDVGMNRFQHRGSRRGSACPPNFNREGGACVRTVTVHGGHPKYDRPHSGCRPDAKKVFTVSLPNGGTRTVRQTCRSGRGMQ